MSPDVCMLNYAQECEHKNQNSILRSYIAGRRNIYVYGKIRCKFLITICIVGSCNDLRRHLQLTK